MRSDGRGRLDAFIDVIGFTPKAPLTTFPEMWYEIFLWALFSSTVVHTIAAVMAFGTLRKHHFGKFFPIALVIMGIGGPFTSGVVSSAAIAFGFRASSMQMTSLLAMLIGVGQTVVSAVVGFTRILATL